MDYITKRRPRVFVLENVADLVQREKRKEDWQCIRNALEAIPGYKVSHKVMHPYEFGLPQSRWRVYIVGMRDAEEAFEFPRPNGPISKANGVAEQEKYVDCSDGYGGSLG